MTQHEKMAWWSLGASALVWLFLLMRFTEDWQIVELSPGSALAAYVQMIVLWIVASAIPAVLSARDPEQAVKDERDRAIEALGDRWEGYVVVFAVNVLIIHALVSAYYTDRSPSLPRLDLGTTTAMIFALLTTLFLADAVKRVVILWQYRK